MAESPIQSPCAAHDVFRLPELQELIICFLDIDDLTQCVLVSRSWNQIFARQLWSTCDDSKKPWKIIIRHACDAYAPRPDSNTDVREAEARSIFIKFSPLVRHLSANAPRTVHLFLDLYRGGLIPNSDEGDNSHSLPQLESINLSPGNYMRSIVPRYHPRGMEIVSCKDPLDDVPVDVLTPKGGDEMGMMDQIRAFWILILDHRASLRRLDFDVYDWQIRAIPTIDPSIDLSSLLDPGIYRDEDAASRQSVMQRAIAQSAAGTRYFVEALQSIPRLEHLRFAVSSGHGLGTLAIFNHGRFDSLQSLDLRLETFSGDTAPFFPKSSNAEVQIGRFRGLFVNRRIRFLRLRAVEVAHLALLVQDIFPSLEHLTMDVLLHNVISSSDSQLNVIENNTLKSLITLAQPLDRLSKVPIRWLALTTFKCRFHQLFLLDTLLEKMPRIENVVNCWGFGNEVKGNGENDRTGDNKVREQPWHKTIRKFESNHLYPLRGQRSALFDILPCLSNIVCLSLGWIKHPVMMQIVAEISLPFLEELRLKIGVECSKYLAHILSSRPRLQVLTGEGLEMKARDVFRAPWVCKRLRELHILVSGVSKLSAEQKQVLALGPPAPRQEEQIIVEQLEAMSLEGKKRLKKEKSLQYDVIVRHRQRDIDLQRKVLAVFAQQEHLEILDVGSSQAYIGMEPLADTLELTLETGLDQLSNLRELRCLGMQNVDHQMREPEADWIAQHWPKFSKLKGCRTDAHYDYGRPRPSIPETELGTSLRHFTKRLVQLKPRTIFYGRAYEEDSP